MERDTRKNLSVVSRDVLSLDDAIERSIRMDRSKVSKPLPASLSVSHALGPRAFTSPFGNKLSDESAS